MGIVSALRVSRNDVNFVIAYDIPEVDIGLVRNLVRKSRNFDAVLPQTGPSQYEPLDIQMPLGMPLISKKAKRQRWLPVAIMEKGTVRPVEYHGSAHINSLCGADGLVSMDVGVAEIKKGMPVSVRLI